MKKSHELKQERTELVTAQTQVTELAQTENREFTPEEATAFDARHAQIADLNAKIKRAEAAEEALRQNAINVASTSASRGEENEMNTVMKRYSLHKAIRSQIGAAPLDGVEREIHEEMSLRASKSGVAISGIAIPSAFRADGQTVTEDSGAYGANLVAEELRQPIEFLRPKPIVQSLGAKMLTGLNGNIAFPTNDGGISAAWEGEIDATATTKNAYGKKTMVPHRLASTVIVSMQNLLQSSIDLERYTIDEINAVIAMKLDEAAINGTGSTSDIPEGILNNASVNVLPGATNGEAPSWGQIIDFETLVYIANANSAMMNYLINPSTKGLLKKTKHQAGDANYLMGTDNTINGYGVGVSNLVPNNLTKGTGTNLSAGIFGDFSQLLIGQWGFNDLHVEKDAKNGNVEVTVNSFYDILLRQPKAFAVVKDWIIS